MQYLLLIAGPEVEPTADQEAAMLAAYDAFGNEFGAKGVLRGGERLRPSTDATTVQVRDGKVLTTDGPFAETKEQIGGYFVVECPNLDEAIGVAAKIPGAQFGSIEVRPIWSM